MDVVPIIKLPPRKEEVTPPDIISALQEILDDPPTLLKRTVQVTVPDFNSIRRKILGNQTFLDGKSIIEEEREGYRF